MSFRKRKEKAREKSRFSPMPTTAPVSGPHSSSPDVSKEPAVTSRESNSLFENLKSLLQTGVESLKSDPRLAVATGVAGLAVASLFFGGPMKMARSMAASKAGFRIFLTATVVAGIYLAGGSMIFASAVALAGNLLAVGYDMYQSYNVSPEMPSPDMPSNSPLEATGIDKGASLSQESKVDVDPSSKTEEHESSCRLG